jgi:hypothetical protein
MLPYHLRPPLAIGETEIRDPDQSSRVCRRERQCPPAKRKRLSGRPDEEIPCQSSELYGHVSFLHGGPIQHAIEKDLAILQKSFVAHFQSDEIIIAESSSILTTTAKPGYAFSSFGDFFAKYKVAALHTRAGPIRGDRQAYSQLIYAACYSILRKTWTKNRAILLKTLSSCDSGICISVDDDVPVQPEVLPTQNNGAGNDDGLLSLLEVSFPVFCLYAFYETNPLPRGPDLESSEIMSKTHLSSSGSAIRRQTQQKYLNMLPMGVMDRENPKFLFRRCFRRSIRTDIVHYKYLLQIRACAVALRDDYEHMILLPDRGNAASFQRTMVAADIIVVLDRLVHNQCLDLCSYTGPCGLEGLAGHPDYPYPATEHAFLAKQQTRKEQPPNGSCPNLHSDTGPHPSPLRKELHESLNDYLKHRQMIRLPPPAASAVPGRHRQTDRIRKAISSMFDVSLSEKGNKASSRAIPQHLVGNESTSSPFSRLFQYSTSGELSKSSEQGEAVNPYRRSRILRHVTFGTVVVGCKTDAPEYAIEAMAEAPAHGNLEGGKSPYEDDKDVTPSYRLKLPEELSSASHRQLDALIDEMFREGDVPVRRDSFPVSATEMVDNDDISTLGPSTAAESRKSVARLALEALLDRAMVHPVDFPAGSVALQDDVQRRAFRIGGTVGETFLTVDEYGSDDEDLHTAEASAVSSDEIESVSAAVSTAGEQALKMLLSSATDNTELRRHKRDNEARKEPERSRDEKKLPPSRQRVLRRDRANSDDQSQGRLAIESLLAHMD